ncbi:MAG: hypothetical protein AB1428_13995 [Bacteroidota bacterium]
MRIRFLLLTTIALALTMTAPGQTPGGGDALPWLSHTVASLEKELIAIHGDAQASRIRRGLRQAALLWRNEDGDAAAFADLARRHFIADPATLDTMFHRCEKIFEQLNGHMVEIGRHLRTQADLDIGPVLPFDEILAGYDPSAHVIDDFFRNKLAFSILLNFPLTTLEERLQNGERWSRRQWAEARLTRPFGKRMPAEVNLAIAEAAAEADQYIAGYNIWMHHVLDAKGERRFPRKLRLLSHWNLRDEIKAESAEGSPGLLKQRLIQTVMERIVTQTIPAAVVNNPGVDWNPATNQVSGTPAANQDGPAKPGVKVSADREPDTRYAVLWKTYEASRKADPYSPTAPSLIARRFNEDREIPEQRVKAMLEEVVSSPLVGRVAALIEKRLGRPLEPFDIWYNGFRSRGSYTEAQLDGIVRKLYPTPEAYRRDIPRLLEKLGFPPERAAYLADHIEVDPARGSGHAMGAAMRSAAARLRTRVEADGMNYKGFNIAVHEMGHNVEQVISLNLSDHTLLAGVPNTAFTEALAFVFQGHDLELLGLTSADPKAEALKTLNDFWGTYEIAGVALVDMRVWHWMYDHPAATPAQLKEATIGIAKEIWNAYYAPVFHRRDVVLLAIYSHMIHSFLYLPDYPIGHLIAHQIEERMRTSGSVGPEFERMALAGNIAPDLWMQKATGAPVGPGAMLAATEQALRQLQGSAAD